MCTFLAASDAVFAHGFAGKRFFPATLVTDDPFVADELSLPTLSYQKFNASGDEPASRETDLSIDVSKRITESFGLGLGASYKQIKPEDGERARGFDNLEASLKYQFYTNEPHEAILSAGLHALLGARDRRRDARRERSRQ